MMCVLGVWLPSNTCEIYQEFKDSLCSAGANLGYVRPLLKKGVMEGWGWRDSLVVKGICCSCRGLWIQYLHLHSGLQLYVSPGP